MRQNSHYKKFEITVLSGMLIDCVIFLITNCQQKTDPQIYHLKKRPFDNILKLIFS